MGPLNGVECGVRHTILVWLGIYEGWYIFFIVGVGGSDTSPFTSKIVTAVLIGIYNSYFLNKITYLPFVEINTE